MPRVLQSGVAASDMPKGGAILASKVRGMRSDLRANLEIACAVTFALTVATTRFRRSVEGPELQVRGLARDGVAVLTGISRGAPTPQPNSGTAAVAAEAEAD